MKLKSQCLRHKRYPNKEKAEEALVNAIHKHRINLTRVYQCSYCMGWHLTSK